jgi:branched-chain amino acid aminotransferase
MGWRRPASPVYGPADHAFPVNFRHEVFMTMQLRANERVAWFNGEFMPEREVRIPFRDSSWVYGDGCFDMTRTFGHRLFKVKEHVDRLYRSLKYLRIDPGFGPGRMCELTEDVFARNRHLLGPDDDYWVGQRISRGVKEVPGDNLDHHGPNIVLECAPLPFAQRAKLFREGIKVITPAHRRVPPDSLTPRAKTHNYLNLIVANQEAQSIDPEAWAVLLDVNGNLAEGMGSNIFVVRGGEIFTPREKFVLPGVSRQTVIDLAREAGLKLIEADLDLYDAYNGDEVFLTSTSLCICPVTQVNGVSIGPDGQVWGPVTQRLADAYRRFVDHDFVGQYLKRYVDGMESRAF